MHLIAGMGESALERPLNTWITLYDEDVCAVAGGLRSDRFRGLRKGHESPISRSSSLADKAFLGSSTRRMRPPSPEWSRESARPQLRMVRCAMMNLTWLPSADGAD